MQNIVQNMKRYSNPIGKGIWQQVRFQFVDADKMGISVGPPVTYSITIAFLF